MDDAWRAAQVAAIIFTVERFGDVECTDGVLNLGLVGLADQERRAVLCGAARTCRAWYAAAAPCLPRLLVIPGLGMAPEMMERRRARVVERLETSDMADDVRTLVLQPPPFGVPFAPRLVACLQALSDVRHLVAASRQICHLALGANFGRVAQSLHHLTLTDERLDDGLNALLKLLKPLASIQFRCMDPGGLEPLGRQVARVHGGPRTFIQSDARMGVAMPTQLATLQRLVLCAPTFRGAWSALESGRDELVKLTHLELNGIKRGGESWRSSAGLLAILPKSVVHLRIGFRTSTLAETKALVTPLFPDLASPLVLPRLRLFRLDDCCENRYERRFVPAFPSRPGVCFELG